METQTSTSVSKQQNENNFREIRSNAFSFKQSFFPKKFRDNFRELQKHDDALVAWATEGIIPAMDEIIKNYGVSQTGLNQALVTACYHGRMNVVKYLLEEAPENYRAKIDANAGYNCNAIKVACQCDKTEIAKYLIARSKYINSNYGEACLIAIKNGNLEIVDAFLKAKLNPNSARGDLLCETIKQNNKEMLKLFLMRNIHPIYLDKAYLVAVEEGNKDMCLTIMNRIKQNGYELSQFLKTKYMKKFC